MTVVIGTAGHIDHGKTTLLRALTGIDADRLPEERARSMTIDVGYAHLALADGTELDFVDVPGHDRLVGNMLVGAGEVDAALLVIAADDGPRPQTIEHLELLDALGIADGIVVLTKADAVAAERLAEVADGARRLVAPTRLRDVDILAVSATTGDGLDALRASLAALRDRLLARAGAAADTAHAPVPGTRPSGVRLAIDRVFSIRGRGTVVTGTLRGSTIERGAVLRVVPDRDARTVRVREVQVHGRTVGHAGPGRVALNVTGDGLAGLERGVVLTNDAAVVATDRLLVALRPVAMASSLAGPAGSGRSRGVGDRPGLPADRARAALHLGTDRVGSAIGRSGRDAVDLADGGGTAILRLERPVAAAAGDSFVLRRPSPVRTVAGGRILDPQPARGVARRRSTPERLRALADAPAGSARWAGARLDLHGALEGPPSVLAPDLAGAIDELLVEGAGQRPGIRAAELTRAGTDWLRRRVGPIGRAVGPASDATDPTRRLAAGRLDALVSAGRLTREADRVLPPGVVADAGPSDAVAAAMDRLVAALASASPPPLAETARAAGCPPEAVRLLEASNRIVRLDADLAWAEPTWRELAARALAMATREPLTPAALRDATGTSRKYVMALLEDLDRRAILRRTAAGHVPGPRASSVAGPGANRPIEAEAAR